MMCNMDLFGYTLRIDRGISSCMNDQNILRENAYASTNAIITLAYFAHCLFHRCEPMTRLLGRNLWVSIQ